MHFIGWAILLGAVLASMGSKMHWNWMLAGAMTSFVSGFGLMAMAGDRSAYSGAQMALKILLTLAILALTAYAYWRHNTARVDANLLAARRGGAEAAIVAPWIRWAIGALTILTLLLSILWR